MAFRYLNDGNPTIPEFNIPIPDAIKEIKTIIVLRICVLSLLNFLTTLETIMKSVGKRIVNPAYPIINVEVLSNIKENNINDIENVGAAHIMKLFLFLRKGNAK